MRVFYSAVEIRGAVKNPVVTVGSFDGVHRGHRAIITETLGAAANIGGESVVVTFAQHPRSVLEGKMDLLNSTEEKLYLLEKSGIDNVLIINFTPEFSQLSPLDFFREYLWGAVGVKALVVGYNHLFGHNRKGGGDYLAELQKEYSFELINVPRFGIDEGSISSTTIRTLVKEGDMKRAGEYLGYDYMLMLNVNDARLALPEPRKILPPDGTYRVEVEAGGRVYTDTLRINSQEGLSLSAPLADNATKVRLKFI